MSPRKTRAFVFQVLPYHESSSILYLYTEAFGMVHGIAKGIRRSRKRRVIVERGQLIELLVYMRPNRSLHTVGSMAVLEFFPHVRHDLLRAAARDAAIELALKSIHDQEPNPELFSHFELYFRSLDNLHPPERSPILIWWFYVWFANRSGFGLDLVSCSRCGKPLADSDGGSVMIQRGGIACTQCIASPETHSFLPTEVIAFLAKDTPGAPPPNVSDPLEVRRITRLLAAFCQHHFGLYSEYRSLQFLCSLI